MLIWIARLFPSLVPLVSALFNPLILVLIAGVAAFSGWQCYRLGAAKLDRYKVEQFEAASALNAKRAGVTAAAEIQYVKVAGDTQFVFRWIEKEVDDYAADNPDGMCLDDRWGRLHDRAVHNTISDPASRPNAALRAPARAAEGLSRPDSR